MRVSVVSIGDSKLIQLPKIVIEKYNIKDTLELMLEEDCIIIKSKALPRKGWEESFNELHENGDDRLLIDEGIDDEDFSL